MKSESLTHSGRFEVLQGPGGRRLRLLANTGCQFARSYGPAMVDLAGVSIPKKLPLLLNHDEDQVAGFADASERTSEGLVLTGPLLGGEEAAKRVEALADAGYPLTASVGVRDIQTEVVPAGKTATCNGRTVEGPLTIWRKSTLHECSVITANPADMSTNVQVLSGLKVTGSAEEWAAVVAKRTGVTLSEAMALRGDGEKLDAFNTALRLGLDGAPLRAAARGQVSKLTIEAMAETAQKESA